MADVTDEEVEAAARAICGAWGYIWDGDHDEDEQVAPDTNEFDDTRPSKELYREGARAALVAVARVREGKG